MRLEPLTDSELESIEAGAYRLLGETGALVYSPKALQILADAGAQVDFERQRVRFPEKLILQALASASGHFRLWRRDGDAPIDLMDGQVRGHNVGGCVRIYDHQQHITRDATRQDLERMTVLIDALENIHVCRPVVYPTEFPTQLRDLYTMAAMLQYTGKPYGVSAYSPHNQEIIFQLASLAAGGLAELTARPFIWGSICPISPLTYTQSTSDILIRYAEVGLPVAIAPCPICGGASPVTLAGTLAQQHAEFLVGMVLVQSIRPGIDVKYTTRAIPMDMRSGMSNFGAVEMGMMSAAMAALARRTRTCSDVYGLGTSSRHLDEQAAYEKAINGLLPALAGADLVAAGGLLENALTSSPEQLVIDNDIFAMIFRAVRGISVTAETLALELIAEVGPKGDFLSAAHTLAFARKEHYVSKLSLKSTKGSAPAGYTIVEAAHEAAEKILQTHQPERLPEAMVEEIEQILAAAERFELN